MAVYTTPTETHEHYVERDTGSGAGVWAVIAVLIVLFALLFFGTNIFGQRNNTPSTNNSSVDVNGSVQTPGTGGTNSGSGQ